MSKAFAFIDFLIYNDCLLGGTAPSAASAFKPAPLSLDYELETVVGVNYRTLSIGSFQKNCTLRKV